MDFKECVWVCLLARVCGMFGVVEAQTMSSQIAAAVSGDATCIACQTKRWDVVLSVTKTMGSFTSHKPEEGSFFEHLKLEEKNTSIRMLLHIHESKGGGISAYYPPPSPFTNSSVLFIPHGGLLHITAGLLTLGNSMQPSMTTGRCGSRPEKPLWLHAFLCCFPKVPNSNKYT